MIDFSTPFWLMLYYYLIGSTSLILNLFTIFLVIFKSDKIDNFRYYLLVFQVQIQKTSIIFSVNFQISCTITDIHTTLLLQPFPLPPMIAGHYKGLITFYLSVNAYHHVVMFLSRY